VAVVKYDEVAVLKLVPPLMPDALTIAVDTVKYVLVCVLIPRPPLPLPLPSPLPLPLPLPLSLLIINQVPYRGRGYQAQLAIKPVSLLISDLPNLLAA